MGNPKNRMNLNVCLYTKYVDGVATEYLFGNRAMAQAMFMEDIHGFPTIQEALDSWERGDWHDWDEHSKDRSYTKPYYQKRVETIEEETEDANAEKADADLGD